MKYHRGDTTISRGIQKTLTFLSMVLVMAIVMVAGAPVALAQLEDIQKPELDVPGVFTLQGEFVRMGYNQEGFVTLGYRVANDSVSDEWMLLEMGVTVLGKTKEYKLKRADITIKLPDGSIVPLASQEEFNKANLRALDRRASMVRDSINYFPVGAKYGCAMKFFADISNPVRGLAYDQVSLDTQRACVGRIYFHIPDGIVTGQYFLNVQFANSVVQVPFRVLTKAEEKEFRKMWKDLKKEHETELMSGGE